MAPTRPKAAAFDLLGTTFSLEGLRPRLAALGLPPWALDLLYAAGLRDAFALAASGGFRPFGEVWDGALLQVAARLGVPTTPAARAQVLAGLSDLSPHPDAAEAMGTLRAAGLRVLVVTNGSAPLAQRLLARAGLDGLAERVVSVDEVRRSKPAPEVYRHAAALLGLAAPEMALVATHPWDIHGARAAGWMGAYVARGVPFPAAVMAPPQVEGETLAEVARRLAALPA